MQQEMARILETGEQDNTTVSKDKHRLWSTT